jgi:hypothetical protein
MRYVGFAFLILALYGTFSTYRVLRYKELYWDYPFIRYRRKEGCSKIVCIVVGTLSIPVILLFFYLAFKILYQ